jgi:hypothetical protein
MLGHLRPPRNLLAKELIEAYPEVRVILSTRDVDSWHASLSSTVHTLVSSYSQRLLRLIHPMLFQFHYFYPPLQLFFRSDLERRRKIEFEEYDAIVRGLVGKELMEGEGKTATIFRSCQSGTNFRPGCDQREVDVG